VADDSPLWKRTNLLAREFVPEGKGLEKVVWFGLPIVGFKIRSERIRILNSKKGLPLGMFCDAKRPDFGGGLSADFLGFEMHNSRNTRNFCGQRASSPCKAEKKAALAAGKKSLKRGGRPSLRKRAACQ